MQQKPFTHPELLPTRGDEAPEETIILDRWLDDRGHYFWTARRMIVAPDDGELEICAHANGPGEAVESVRDLETSIRLDWRAQGIGSLT